MSKSSMQLDQARKKIRASILQTPPDEMPALIGVGASAGGLEALRLMVGSIKNLSNASIVVVQHLSPQHRSMLVDLISRETSLTVKEVENGTRPQNGMIYITPPNTNVLYSNGELVLRKPTPGVGPKPSVNLFFESLAEELGEAAVGVILSGTGSDGSRGMRAIKAAGGVTLAQTAESAKYDGMPVAAIESGAVDIVADAEEIGRELGRIGRYQYRENRVSPTQIEVDDPYLARFAKVKGAFGVDFL